MRFTAALFALLLLSFLPLHAQTVLINEVMSSNGTTLRDMDGDYPDWIEFYNPSTEAINLAGFGLSDAENRPFRWTFPARTIPAGGYVVVFASGKDRSGAQLHSDFSISASGETVFLTAPDSSLVDRLDLPAIPRDISLGRLPDAGSDWVFFQTPTPGAANGGSHYLDVLAAPSFSHTAGFYSSPFTLTITSPDTAITIRYTLDGSEPGPQSPVFSSHLEIRSRAGDPNVLSLIPTSHDYSVFAEPMGEIFKGTVVRAAAFRSGAVNSPVTTGTFFVDPSLSSRYSVPVMSLTTHRDSLFGDARGIYALGDLYDAWRAQNPGARASGTTPTNYRMRGPDWERPAHFEMFDRQGHRVLAQEVAIRIHGGLSRNYRQKSLRLYARSGLGESYFEYPIFEEKDIDRFKRLMLRNSGQDWTKTLFRDAFMQRLVRHMDVDYQAYEPAVLFINGEYWGINNLRERIDQYYLEENYGVDPEAVDLLTGSGVAKYGSNAHYRALTDYVSANDLRQPAHYEHVRKQMDVDNFIDYQIAQIYVRNNDWPHNNIDFWRERTTYDPDAPRGRDGRWRWILFDMDFGFGWSAMPRDLDMVAWALNPNGNTTNGAWATLLLRRLMQNQAFRTQFVNRFADQLNTALRPDHVLELIDEFERRLEPEIVEHIHRWGFFHDQSRFHRTPRHIDDWRGNIDTLRIYANVRGEVVWDHLDSNLSLGGTGLLTVNVSDPRSGFVQVNSIDILPTTVGIRGEAYPWSGRYFRNVPVRLTAQARPGYRFAGWSGSVGGSNPSVSLAVGTQSAVTARFEVNTAWLEDVFPAPHNLAESDYAMTTWPEDAAAGSFPVSMAFFYMDEAEPTLTAVPEAPTSGAYNLSSRTRINGLGDGGIAFINTSNLDGNPGYPGMRLGAAVLALDTRGRSDIRVTWTGGTVVPDVRHYHMRLQYRLGNEGELVDILDGEGRSVEYRRSDRPGHAEVIGPIRLPAEAEDHPYVQVWWRYYHTGERDEGEGGARDMLRIADILVQSERGTLVEPEIIADAALAIGPNHPNPFSDRTEFTFFLPEASAIDMSLYDLHGRRVLNLADGYHPAGSHALAFDAGSLASGVYVIRLSGERGQAHRRIVIVR
jgi:hypothetical protein